MIVFFFFAPFPELSALPRRDGNRWDNIIPICNKYRHVGLVRQYWCVCLSSGCLWGSGKGGRVGSGGVWEGGYYGRASELYALPHVCRINLFQPRFPAPLRLRWSCSGFERRRTEWLTAISSPLLAITSYRSCSVYFPQRTLYFSNFPRFQLQHILPNAWRTDCKSARNSRSFSLKYVLLSALEGELGNRNYAVIHTLCPFFTYRGARIL